MSISIFNEFINENVAPYSSEYIGVFNSNDEMVGKISLSNFKPNYGERLFRFGILSDVHNNNVDSQTNEDIVDFENALTFFNNKESVNMTCICGDITQGGRPAQFGVYKGIVEDKSSNTPVYTTTGNHDCPNSGDLNNDDWEPYTGNKKTFEITKNINGENIHFLF